MKKHAATLASFDNIQAFLDDSRGQITIGEIPPIRSAALAAEGKKVRVALVRRDKETVAELLLRLDISLGKAIAENTAARDPAPPLAVIPYMEMCCASSQRP